MKPLFRATVTGLALCCVSALPAFAAGVCLNLDFVRNTQVAKDGTSISFEMKDGKTWRNDLRGACPDVYRNGFVWSQNAGRVCDDAAQVKALQSVEICNLGKFTDVTPPRKHP